MRLQSNLPANLWPELVHTGAHLLNRSPIRQLNWRTPIEVLYRALNNSVRIPTLFYARCYGYAPGMSTADLFRIYILSAYVFRSFPKHIRKLPLFSASSFFL